MRLAHGNKMKSVGGGSMMMEVMPLKLGNILMDIGIISMLMAICGWVGEK